MKRVKTILVAVVIGCVVSCSKSDLVEPVAMQDSPHKKDTTLNNPIPHTVLTNQ